LKLLNREGVVATSGLPKPKALSEFEVLLCVSAFKSKALSNPKILSKPKALSKLKALSISKVLSSWDASHFSVRLLRYISSMRPLLKY
jgi:hypothetical protein